MKYSLSADQNWQLGLNRRLSLIATELTEQLEARWDKLGPVDRFFLTLYNKIHRSFDTIQLLAEHGFIEDALCILRIMLESTINLTYAAKTDPLDALKRYWDWAMLEAVRRDRANNFHRGTSHYSEDRERSLLNAEREIRQRRTPEELESLKRGVFGISVEERARQAGMIDDYNQLYRLTSRNVHAMDIAEMRTARDYSLDEGEFDQFVEMRVDVMLSFSRRELGKLTIWLDKVFSCGKSDVLAELNTEELNHEPPKQD